MLREPAIEHTGFIRPQHRGLHACDDTLLEHLDMWRCPSACTAHTASFAADADRLRHWARPPIEFVELTKHRGAHLTQLGLRGRGNKKAKLFRRALEVRLPIEVFRLMGSIPNDQRLFAFDLNRPGSSDRHARLDGRMREGERQERGE